MNITSTDLLKDITMGKFNSEELDAIFQAVKFQKETDKDIAARRLGRSIKKGDHIWFNESTRPTYIIGCEAVVVKVNPKKIVVDLVKPTARFHRNVTVSLSLITTKNPNV